MQAKAIPTSIPTAVYIVILGDTLSIGGKALATIRTELPSTISAILSGITSTTAFAIRSASCGSVLVTVTEKTSVSFTDVADSISAKSASVYKSVVVMYKSIFRAACESRVIEENPTIYLTSKGGGIPPAEKQALTDAQVDILLETVKHLPPYVFVMLGLYAGLRREEILGLKWDSVYLNAKAPYLTVRRAWHTEHNRPVILDELKTNAANRNIPLPDCLVECLKEAKAKATSEFVVANRNGEPLSYTQFKRLWKYIDTRTVKERVYYRYEDGKRVKHTVNPVLGEKAAHNGHVIYTLDFEVTPHQLRHTYITNLIHASVDPKTVQYLAGHENSKITMDIYAKVKYNQPHELAAAMSRAFAQWDSA